MEVVKEARIGIKNLSEIIGLSYITVKTILDRSEFYNHRRKDKTFERRASFNYLFDEEFIDCFSKMLELKKFKKARDKFINFTKEMNKEIRYAERI